MTQNFEEKMILPTLVKRTIHNFSSYLLTREEQIALSYGLEKHIPDSTNKSLYTLTLSISIKTCSIILKIY